MGFCISWPRAFSISCLLHLFLLAAAGCWVANIQVRLPVETYITVDLNPAPTEPVGTPDSAPAVLPDSLMTLPSVNRQQTAMAPRITDAPAAERFAPVIGAIPAISVDAATVIGAGTGYSGSRTVKGDGDSGTMAGAGSGTTADSAGETGAAVDTSIIIEAFLREIEKHKEYPYIARKQGQTGTVELMIELGSGGELQNLRVLRPSGFIRLDEAAVVLVRRICPFPHDAGRTIAMRIPITYEFGD